MREARAVGDGVHIMAYNLANEGPSSNVHREHLNELWRPNNLILLIWMKKFKIF